MDVHDVRRRPGCEREKAAEETQGQLQRRLSEPGGQHHAGGGTGPSPTEAMRQRALRVLSSSKQGRG